MEKQCIFISSVQQEFKDERKALTEYIRHDLLLSRYFEPFIFEDFRTIIWQETHIVGPKTHIAESTMHIATMDGLNPKQRKVVNFCDTPKSSHEIIDHLGIVYQARAVKRYITDLVETGHLLPLVLGKTTSPNQKYIRAIHREKNQ